MSSHEPSTADPAVGPTHCVVILDEPAKRRNVVYAILATIIGGIVGLFPFLSGLALFLDPAIKTRKAATGTPGVPPKDDEIVKRRLASYDSIPENGTPIQVPVIADLKDIWTVEPNQPIGAVYLRRLPSGDVECFNAICPHAGCFVSYAATRKVYQCPCHNSAFASSGARILPSPSPRDMDKLEVELREVDGDTTKKDVWVAFANYYPGKEHPERKPS